MQSMTVNSTDPAVLIATKLAMQKTDSRLRMAKLCAIGFIAILPAGQAIFNDDLRPVGGRLK